MFGIKTQNIKRATKSLSKNKNKLVDCRNCLVNDEDLLKMATEHLMKEKICLKHRGAFQKYLAANDFLAALPER